ncbi:hypothetical protein EST38_g7727 [Candolleomyces aberdarensis]|uniref:Uncharacterized protein n=1 Tax=Candolleomyces aberdarensis TaxID=2316362 RepID=A0A4Q2DGK0_9AGAR|nr:hypothetical protein EST38_g7727 [Candolleomyces aberdarensis]
MLASYLVKENDIALVDYILAPLERTVAPEVDIAMDETKFRSSLHAVKDLTSVMLAIHEHPQNASRTGDASAYKSAVFPSLCEKWPMVINGLRILMHHPGTSKDNDASKSIEDCVEVLKVTLLVYRDSGYAEELFSLACTIDFIYFLLCRAEVNPVSDHAIRSVFSALTILGLCLENDTAGRSSFALRLSTITKAKRNSVIGALVRRARDLANHGCNTHHLRRSDLRCDAPYAFQALIGCTMSLLDANPSLFQTFLHHNFLFEYAEAMFRVVKSAASLGASSHEWQEFWRTMILPIGHFHSKIVMKHCPNRTYGLATVIEGGLINAALICLIYCAPTGTFRSNYELLKSRITEMVSCDFQFSRVVKAVSKTHSRQIMEQLKGTNGLEVLYWRFESAFHTGSEVFEVAGRPTPGSSINLCDNFKREDWKSFHRYECAARSSSYQEQKVKNIWETLLSRRDQLSYLEHTLNYAENLGHNGTLDSDDIQAIWEDAEKRFPPLSNRLQRQQELKGKGRQKRRGPFEPDQVITIDLINYAGVTQTIVPIDECLSAVWDKIRDAPSFKRRVDAMIELVQDRVPSSHENGKYNTHSVGEGECKIRLVQGIFYHDDRNFTLVLTTVVYTETTSDGDMNRRYRILNSLFCLCDPAIVEKGIWNGKSEATPAMVPQASNHLRMRLEEEWAN